MLTKQDVQKIALLARLMLSEAEMEKFAGQLTKILDYVAKLQEVNTDGVEPTGQVTGLSHVLRKDEVKAYGDIESLLSQTKYPVVDHQIKVKKVM